VHDATFAKTTGKLWHRDSGDGSVTVYDYEPYGVAESCEIDTPGKSNIDLTQTPFIVKSKFRLIGASPYGTTTFDKTRQMVDITGGGFCGSNGLENWNYYRPRTAPQFVLELELRPQVEEQEVDVPAVNL
jgi:hypothetical protein